MRTSSTCPATAARGRCGAATPPRASSSSTSTATCSRARRACAAETGFLDPGAGRALAALADFVADSWRRKDAGIWEVRDGLSDFVQSKAMCWTALDRAAELAAAGAIPGGGARWREEAEAVRAWIESEGWNEELGSYVRAPELGDEVDASLLSLPLCAYSRAADPRFLATADTIRRELGAGGPLLYRTRVAQGERGRVSRPARSGSSTRSAAPAAPTRATS